MINPPEPSIVRSKLGGSLVYEGIMHPSLFHLARPS